MPSLADTFARCHRIGRDARQIADALKGHLPTITDNRLRAGLHRVEVASRDFALAVDHAVASLTSAARAAIEG